MRQGDCKLFELYAAERSGVEGLAARPESQDHDPRWADPTVRRQEERLAARPLEEAVHQEA